MDVIKCNNYNMERNTAFLLRQSVVINTINEENVKEEKFLQQLREEYKNKINDTRSSYNSLMKRRSMDLKTLKDTPSLEKIIQSRQMQSRQHQLSLGKIMKQLNLKSPDPKDKFYQYLRLPSSHRTNQHIKTLEFYLKQYVFMQAHPSETHVQLCANIMIKQGHQCTESDIVMIENPIRIHNQFKPKGFKVDLKDMIPHESYLCIDKIRYKEIVERYCNDHYKEIQSFISKLQLFNDVDSELMNKISRAAEVIFRTKGEPLYQVQDPADKIFVVFKGRLARKIIIQIEKNNVLPLEKQQILTTNTIYQVEIEFTPKDVLGYLEILQDPPLASRSETILACQNSIVIGISYQLVRELRAANFKWFRKQRGQKYPKNYQQLCNHYEEKMAFNKKVKLMAKSSFREDKKSVLALDNYKIENIKYVRSNSMYKLRKSIY